MVVLWLQICRFLLPLADSLLLQLSVVARSVVHPTRHFLEHIPGAHAVWHCDNRLGCLASPVLGKVGLFSKFLMDSEVMRGV